MKTIYENNLSERRNAVATIEQNLESTDWLVRKTRGTSMRPMLRQRRDLVVIEKINKANTLQPLDVVLYKRGEQNVLHRVIALSQDGYLTRGDNTYRLEKVPFEAVIGVLDAFTRKGKSYSVRDRSYLRYARLWTKIYPLRAALHKARNALVALLRALGLLQPLKKLLGRE